MFPINYNKLLAQYNCRDIDTILEQFRNYILD